MDVQLPKQAEKTCITIIWKLVSSFPRNAVDHMQAACRPYLQPQMQAAMQGADALKSTTWMFKLFQGV